jgi:hypothetical protein
MEKDEPYSEEGVTFLEALGRRRRWLTWDNSWADLHNPRAASGSPSLVAALRMRDLRSAADQWAAWSTCRGAKGSPV